MQDPKNRGIIICPKCGKTMLYVCNNCGYSVVTDIDEKKNANDVVQDAFQTENNIRKCEICGKSLTNPSYNQRVCPECISAAKYSVPQMSKVFCRYCGSEMRKEAVICVKCGCPVSDNTSSDRNREKKKFNPVLLLIMAIILVVGIGSYLIVTELIIPKNRVNAVKQGHPNDYPGKTYEAIFSSYFEEEIYWNYVPYSKDNYYVEVTAEKDYLYHNYTLYGDSTTIKTANVEIRFRVDRHSNKISIVSAKVDNVEEPNLIYYIINGYNLDGSH